MTPSDSSGPDVQTLETELLAIENAISAGEWSTSTPVEEAREACLLKLLNHPDVRGVEAMARRLLSDMEQKCCGHSHGVYLALNEPDTPLRMTPALIALAYARREADELPRESFSFWSDDQFWRYGDASRVAMRCLFTQFTPRQTIGFLRYAFTSGEQSVANFTYRYPGLFESLPHLMQLTNIDWGIRDSVFRLFEQHIVSHETPKQAFIWLMQVIEDMINEVGPDEIALEDDRPVIWNLCEACRVLRLVGPRLIGRGASYGANFMEGEFVIVRSPNGEVEKKPWLGSLGDFSMEELNGIIIRLNSIVDQLLRIWPQIYLDRPERGILLQMNVNRTKDTAFYYYFHKISIGPYDVQRIAKMLEQQRNDVDMS
jgi:hypothetical protein